MGDLRIQIFPPHSYREYKSVLDDIHLDDKHNVEFEADDSLITPEGIGSIPDVVQIHLDPEATTILLKYMLYVYAGKKLLNGAVYVGKKIIDGIASEAGKDLYLKIIDLVKKLLVKRKEDEEKGPCNPLWIRIKGYFRESVIIILIQRAGDRDVIIGKEIMFVCQEGFEIFGSSVLAVIDRIIEIIGGENLVIVAALHTHNEANYWDIVFQKTIVPNPARFEFVIYCCFDSNGICTNLGFDEKNANPYTKINDESLRALTALKDSILKE